MAEALTGVRAASVGFMTAFKPDLKPDLSDEVNRDRERQLTGAVLDAGLTAVEVWWEGGGAPVRLRLADHGRRSRPMIAIPGIGIDLLRELLRRCDVDAAFYGGPDVEGLAVVKAGGEATLLYDGPATEQ